MLFLFVFYVAEHVVQSQTVLGEVPDAKGKLASLFPKIIGHSISDLIDGTFTVKYCVWTCTPHSPSGFQNFGKPIRIRHLFIMMKLYDEDIYEPAGSKLHGGLMRKCFKLLIKWVGGTFHDNARLILTLFGHVLDKATHHLPLIFSLHLSLL